MGSSLIQKSVGSTAQNAATAAGVAIPLAIAVKAYEDIKSVYDYWTRDDNVAWGGFAGGGAGFDGGGASGSWPANVVGAVPSGFWCLVSQCAQKPGTLFGYRNGNPAICAAICTVDANPASLGAPYVPGSNARFAIWGRRPPVERPCNNSTQYRYAMWSKWDRCPSSPLGATAYPIAIVRRDTGQLEDSTPLSQGGKPEEDVARPKAKPVPPNPNDIPWEDVFDPAIPDIDFPVVPWIVVGATPIIPPLPGGGYVQPPRQQPRQPPKEGQKENKSGGRSRRFMVAAFKALDKISEAAEVVDALYDALPKDVQRKWDCGSKRDNKNPGANLIDNAGQYGIDRADCKAKAIWHNLHKLDTDQAIKNIIKNEVEDYILGRLHRATPKNTGSALNPAFKEVSKAIDSAFEAVGW